LIEALTRDFKEKTGKQFALYHSNKSKAEQIVSLKQSEKEEQKRKIKLILKQIKQQINATACRQVDTDPDLSV